MNIETEMCSRQVKNHNDFYYPSTKHQITNAPQLFVNFTTFHRHTETVKILQKQFQVSFYFLNDQFLLRKKMIDEIRK